MDTGILRKVGLQESEIRVYLTLFELGETLASEIAKKCDLHRTNVYDILDKLIKKGLVSFVTKENRRYFQATNPEKLWNVLEEKKQEIERQKSNIKKIISELKKKKKLNKCKTEAYVYKGKEGFKTVMEDALKEGKDLLILGGSGKSIQLVPYYMPQFSKKRQKLGIKLKIIYANTIEARKRGKEQAKEKLVQIKYLPKEIKNITVIQIYGDKVAMIPITSNVLEEPIIFLIDNKETANSFRDYFNWVWKLAK